MEQINLLNFDFANDSEAKRRQMGKARKEYYRKNKKCCARCGMTDEIQIHHKIKVEDGGSNEESNLIALCITCHKEYHRYFEHKSYKQFTAYPKHTDLNVLWDVITSDDTQDLTIREALEIFNAYMEINKGFRSDEEYLEQFMEEST